MTNPVRAARGCTAAPRSHQRSRRARQHRESTCLTTAWAHILAGAHCGRPSAQSSAGAKKIGHRLLGTPGYQRVHSSSKPKPQGPDEAEMDWTVLLAFVPVGAPLAGFLYPPLLLSLPPSPPPLPSRSSPSFPPHTAVAGCHWFTGPNIHAQLHHFEVTQRWPARRVLRTARAHGVSATDRSAASARRRGHACVCLGNHTMAVGMTAPAVDGRARLLPSGVSEAGLAASMQVSGRMHAGCTLCVCRCGTVGRSPGPPQSPQGSLCRSSHSRPL